MNRVVEASRSYLGVRWKHLGRSHQGVDCIGLVLLAHKDAGIELPDPAPYGREPESARIVVGLEAMGAVRVQDAAPGAVLVFRVDGVNAGHVGIAAWRDGMCTVIHAYAPRRRVVEEPLSHDLEEALIGAWRIGG